MSDRISDEWLLQMEEFGNQLMDGQVVHGSAERAIRGAMVVETVRELRARRAADLTSADKELLTRWLATAADHRAILDGLVEQLNAARQLIDRVPFDAISAMTMRRVPGGVLDVKRGLYAIIYGDNGATAREVEAARAWLRSQGIEPT